MRGVAIKKNIIYFLFVLTTVIYLLWRGIFTLPWNESVFALIFGMFLWISEIVSSFTAIILIWNKTTSSEITKPDINQDLFPDVDLIIATHNEEIELLFKTVNAATHIKYPEKEKVHIYLSDDSNRLEVKKLAEEFGIGYISIENNQHAKSGNLNNTLKNISSPLIATFDADMIPFSNFLLETVPYFVEDWVTNTYSKRLGLVQTPQSFYNADLFQFNLFSESYIPNEQDYFSREINVANNSHDAAIYTGSNTLILREAIDRAGGFPINTVTEDFELGIKINACGYRNISTLEPLASGITTSDVPSMIKQRIRWGRGVIQSTKNVRLLTNSGLTIPQKLIFLNSYLYWWAFARRLLYIFAPILFTVFNIRVVDTGFWILLMMWLPSFLLLRLVMKDFSSDIRTQQWGEVQETIFAPYMVFPIFLQTIGIKEKKFKVTDKNAKQSRKDYLYIFPHLIMFILIVIGIVKFNYGKYGSEIFYGSVITFWLLTHLYNLTFSILFFLGRPKYRVSERFLSENPITVRSKRRNYTLMTKNTSENGLSFYSNIPLFFYENETLLFTVSRGEYEAQMTGRIVRVFESDDGWVYGVSLDKLEYKDKLQYLQIIYDGYNKSLPQFLDPWISSFDIFFANIANRFKRKSNNKRLHNNKYPLVHLNEEIVSMGIRLVVCEFNFVNVTIKSFEDASNIKYINLKNNPFTFELELVKKENHTYIFEVVNLEDLLCCSEFDNWIKNLKDKGE